MACVLAEGGGSGHFYGQPRQLGHFQAERGRGAAKRSGVLSARVYTASSSGKSVLRRRSTVAGGSRCRLTAIGAPRFSTLILLLRSYWYLMRVRYNVPLGLV